MSGHVSVQDADTRRVAPDTAHRKRAQRRGRERGCWVYIDAEQLTRAGINPLAEPPYYRCNGLQAQPERSYRNRQSLPGAMMDNAEKAKQHLGYADRLADFPERASHAVAVAQVYATLAVADELARLFAEGLTTNSYVMQP